MEYITEIRGGWDEWSDKHEVVLSVRIDGQEFDRFLKGKFTDRNGNKLDVEFPSRTLIESKIIIERYEPDYQRWNVGSLEEFEQIADISSFTLDVEQL